MLFHVNGDKLLPANDLWPHRELEIEKLIVSTTTDENPILSEEIFGEELFLLGRQNINSDNKRSDILALDKNGYLVVVELKKEEGRIGVEMQALQYLSNWAPIKGKSLISRLGLTDKEGEIEEFLHEGISLEDINTHSRIVLMARYFDRALFSMGKWLSDQGISFRCIAYEPIKVSDTRLLNFSIVFDQASSKEQFRLEFSKPKRIPEVFWHIIGSSDPEWWNFLRKTGVISTSFDCQPGDRGEEILKNYVKGDRILAYISGIGLVGFGEITDPKYQLLAPGTPGDVFPESGEHLHRLSINWIATLNLNEAISVVKIEKEYGVSHPIQTSSRIKKGRVEDLINAIKKIAT